MASALTSAGSVGLLLVALQSAALACDPMTILSPPEGRTVHFVDLDDSGDLSAGDRRLGQRQMFDEAGNRVGVYYFVSTVHEHDPESGDSRTSSDPIYVFDDGVIFGSFNSVGQRPHYEQEQLAPPSNTYIGRVVGGNGAYEGASGTVAATIEDLDIELRFDISCE